MGPHGSQCDIAIGIQNPFRWREGVTFVGIQNNGVDLVESSKEIPDVFCRTHDSVVNSSLKKGLMIIHHILSLEIFFNVI